MEEFLLAEKFHDERTSQVYYGGSNVVKGLTRFSLLVNLRTRENKT
jgi:hypothetical protein